MKECEIEKLFASLDREEIKTAYTKEQLVDMYKVCYNTKPLTHYTKREIVNNIGMYFHTKRRAKGIMESFKG